MTWGQRKRFADGKVSMPYKQFLGYEKGEDGRPKIVEKEAKVVRMIYKLFLEGKTVPRIAKLLSDEGIPTPSGKQKWHSSTVESILTNEKIKGDALLQKSYTTDFLTKKKKVNEGEIPQYYVENSHPAIVSPDVFDLVQHELKKRKDVKGYKTGGSIFSGKIICGECGSFYGSKVCHSTSKYRRMIWQCNHKFKNDQKCRTPHLSEDALRKAFMDGFNSLIDNKDEILTGLSTIFQLLTDTSELDKKSAKLQTEVEVVAALLHKCVEENAHSALDQKEYQERYSSLVDRFEKAKNGLKVIDDERQERSARRENIESFIRTLENSDVLITEFDEELWIATVESVTVHAGHDITITFKDGTKLDWNI